MLSSERYLKTKHLGSRDASKERSDWVVNLGRYGAFGAENAVVAASATISECFQTNLVEKARLLNVWLP